MPASTDFYKWPEYVWVMVLRIKGKACRPWASLSSCVQMRGSLSGQADSSPIPTITVTRHQSVSKTNTGASSKDPLPMNRLLLPPPSVPSPRSLCPVCSAPCPVAVCPVSIKMWRFEAQSRDKTAHCVLLGVFRRRWLLSEVGRGDKSVTWHFFKLEPCRIIACDISKHCSCSIRAAPY